MKSDELFCSTNPKEICLATGLSEQSLDVSLRFSLHRLLIADFFVSIGFSNDADDTDQTDASC